MTTPPPPLADAAAAIAAGDHQRARHLLLPVIRANPQIGEAWYLLAQIVDNPAQRQECLQRAAAAGFAPPTAPSIPSPAPPPVMPVTPPNVQTAAALAGRNIQTHWLMIGGALVVFVFLGIVLAALLQPRHQTIGLVSQPTDTLEARAPTRTPLPRRTPTLTQGSSTPMPGSSASALPTLTPVAQPAAIVTYRTSLIGHTSVVWKVAWSPDGTTLASVSADKTVRLWKADGRPITTLAGHTLGVWTSAWSPDGKILASASDDTTVRLWRADGSPLATLEEHTHWVSTLSWSPDGQILASGGDTTVRLWDADGRARATLEGHQYGVNDVRWSPDGTLLASAGDYDGAVRVWRPDGTLVTTLEGPINRVWEVAWSPDSQRLASASSDGIVRIWQVDGTLLATLDKHTDSVTTLAWSPDGQTLITGSDDHTIRLWRTDGDPVAVLEGHHGVVHDVAWSPDGAAFASASLDQTVRLWRADGTPLAELTGHTDRVLAVAWSPNGQLLASASADTTVRLWAIGLVTPETPPITSNPIGPAQSVGLTATLVSYRESTNLFTLSVPEAWVAPERTVMDGQLVYTWQPSDDQEDPKIFVLISNGMTQPSAHSLMNKVIVERYTTPYGAVARKTGNFGADAQYRSVIYIAAGITMQAEVIAQRTGPYLVIVGVEGREESMQAAKDQVSTILTSLQIDPVVTAPEIGVK